MGKGTFQISVPQHTLDDLQARLRRTRWADEIDEGWTFGTDRAELHRLIEHWTGAFDWRCQEEAMNRLGATELYSNRSMVGILEMG